MKKTIWEQVSKAIDAFHNSNSKRFPNYVKNQKRNIELIDLYWISRFRDGDTTDAGLRKGFFNIIKHAVRVASKMIDVDTKDVKIVAEEGQSYYPAWLYGKDLRIWMKDKKNKNGKTFGQFMNKLVYSFPKYGHLLVKKAKDTDLSSWEK